MFSRNFGAAAKDYASHRAGFPQELFDRLEAEGVIRAGSLVLDVGTGTGSLGRGFALRWATVTGVDPDSRLLGEASLLDESFGVRVEYCLGAAESLPFPDSSFDLVCAGQCWHWFDSPRAAAEFARVTKGGGLALVAHFDWIPYRGGVAAATETLIQKHNPSWAMGGGNGFHSEAVNDLQDAGFRNFSSFSFDLDVPYSPESWRRRIRASAGVGASLTPEKVEEFDADLKALLEASFPGSVLALPHRVSATWAESPTSHG
jgi:ubiquinone/menaquinone biosynthesis C-methylase UbiE